LAGVASVQLHPTINLPISANAGPKKNSRFGVKQKKNAVYGCHNYSQAFDMKNFYARESNYHNSHKKKRRTGGKYLGGIKNS